MQQHATSTVLRLGLALCCAIGAAVAQAGGAGALSVTVRDRDGKPVDDVAVYALPSASNVGGHPDGKSPPVAVMDQYDKAFVPHILVVQTGTRIAFPNHDSVSHHVYSFSPAKPFELGLYKGSAHPPLTFDKAGVVILGCNIHDNMLGYIFVVDTPYFAKTDATGHATLDTLPPGGYTVRVWTPRARDDEMPAGVLIDVDAQSDRRLDFELEGKLYPPHEDGHSNLSWSRY
jgi:plastocyanin